MMTAVEVALSLHPLLEVVQELLLGAHNAPRAADTAQSDCLRRGVAVVFHHVQGDICAGSAEASLAVDGDSPLLRMCQAWKMVRGSAGGGHDIMVAGEIGLSVKMLQ